MTLKRRLQCLESRVTPNTVILKMKNGTTRRFSAETVYKAYAALVERTEERHKTLGNFPIPSEAINDILGLREMLDSTAVERDLPGNLPVGPVIKSIRLMAVYRPYELQSDKEGRFMMKPSLIGPICIRIIRALNGRPHPDQLGDD